MPEYLIKFPELRFFGIHARQAKEEALKYFKNHYLDIEWQEIKDDEN